MDVDQTLAKLTLPQKIKLISGAGWWQTEAIPEASIPAVRMSDGPNGVRGSRYFNGVPASCFPAATGMGSSFDVNLARQIGEALGDEARAKGCHVLLGPTVNMQRSPTAGRGFESFSEDPLLNGTIAAAYINGLQSKGVAATVKHFVANDQEFQRFSMSSNVSERALREIYLKPFQIAIREANPWALMTAYNRVNGVHASENEKLLKDILRKEWGYQGMTMSDWTGLYSTSKSIQAGLDLEMPGPTVMRGKAVERCLMGGKILPRDIDDRVRKILGLVKHAKESKIPFDAPETSLDTPELRQLLRTAAADAIVLLKNDKHVLPLPSNLKTIAVIGPNAKVSMTSGGGSAELLSTYTVSPLQGITAAAEEMGAEVKFSLGTPSHRYLPLLDRYIRQQSGEAGAFIEFWNQTPADDFLDPEAVLGAAPLNGCDWSTSTLGTNCLMVDGIDASKVNPDCFVRYSTTFVPDEDGDWELGMSLGGRGNMFVDGKLIVNLSTDWEPGESFLGFGTIEKRSIIPQLRAGHGYEVEVRMSTSEFIVRTPIACWGGIRVGGVRYASDEEVLNSAIALAKESAAVILVIGLNHDWESEGFDRPTIDLPLLTNLLVSAVLRANPQTVVVNQSGSPVAMPWIKDASTVLQAFYGGNELGNGLADILWGKVNPSAKLSVTFPQRLEDTPSYPCFGERGQEHGNIHYTEGIFVGYRGFEVRNLETLFPFGFGLSYATFEYSDLEASSISQEGEFYVTFRIKNTGRMAGREVAQLYISDAQASLPRPAKELKGFAKVALEGGQTQTVKVNLNREALGFYDETRMCWVAEAGIFRVLVASSSVDVRLTREIELGTTFTWTGL